MISEPLAIALMIFSWCYGFLWAWGICHDDGRSPFWTGFMDVFTLRILWKGARYR